MDTVERKIVRRAAYFALCVECKDHGHIVCADGTKSDEFLTVVSGLRELTELVLAEKVASDEMKEARRQIEESGLEYRNIKIERLTEEVLEQDVVDALLEEFHRNKRPAVIQAAHDAHSPTGSKRTLN